MDKLYLLFQVTHLNWPGFHENFFASCNLQQFQVKSSMNTRKLNLLSLWQAIAEYRRK